MHSLFEQVTLRMLAGGFVCESTAPEAFRWLSNDPVVRDDVNDYLSRIGRRLASTADGQAYYATWQKITEAERGEVKKVFQTIKQQLRPIMHFIELCMAIEKQDYRPEAGDRLDYAPMLRTVTENSHLREMLRDFSAMGKEFIGNDASANGMLTKVMHTMVSMGYLVLINREQEAYRFTGKLSYYYQCIEFFVDNEENITDPAAHEEEAPEQSRLL